MRTRRDDVPPALPPPTAGRVPPHDLDAEGSVLSPIICGETNALDIVRAILTPDKCYSDANRNILRAAIALRDARQPVDVRTIAGYLRTRNALDGVGGAKYLAQLADATPDPRNVEAHARHVADLGDLRNFMAECLRIHACGYGDVGDARQYIIDGLQRLTSIVTQGARGRRGATTDEIIRDLLEPSSERSPVRVYTGIRSLDSIAGPLEGGESVLVLAYPGQGKSSLCSVLAARVGSVAYRCRCAVCGWEGLNPGLADNVPAAIVHCPMCETTCACKDRYREEHCTAHGLSATTGQGVIIFTHEFPKERYALRLASVFAGVSAKRIRAIADGTDPACRQETEDDLWTCERVARALARVRSKYIRIIDDCRDIDDISAETHAFKAELARDGVPLRLLANDYSQRTQTRKKHGSREQEVSYVARTWKDLCMACDAPGVMPGQLNKDGLKEKREPRARDARESEGLHNEADRVIIIWNPERAQNALQYGEDGENHRGAKPPEPVKLILDKSREGDTGTARAAFHPTTTSFTDWHSQYGCKDEFEERWERAMAEDRPARRT